jgi:predicted AAA+ superfamily ATPase
MIKRKLLALLREHVPETEITLITGPRQAGKTFLMNLLKKELDDRGEKTLFLNLDIESDKIFFSSQSRLIQKIELELGKQKGYVFIDEIQRKENAGLFLKGLADMNLPYKFIVSGSGSLGLKDQIPESLAGRKRLFKLGTVSFEEFVDYKTGGKYSDRLPAFFEIEQEKTQNLLLEYLNYGGYPRVVLAETTEQKRLHIDEIYSSYIERDISAFLNVEKLDAYRNLVRILASQIGQLMNYSELSNTIGIATSTLKSYINYGEDTFIFQRLSPYATNVRKEITKSPLLYFYDTGLRNYCLGQFGQLFAPGELGHLFENFIFNLLMDKLKFTGCSLHYWRSKDQAEVDFVIQGGKKLIPIEVKYKESKKKMVTPSLKNFITRYAPSIALIVNPYENEVQKIESAEVHFIRPWSDEFGHLIKNWDTPLVPIPVEML